MSITAKQYMIAIDGRGFYKPGFNPCTEAQAARYETRVQVERVQQELSAQYPKNNFQIRKVGKRGGAA